MIVCRGVIFYIKYWGETGKDRRLSGWGNPRAPLPGDLHSRLPRVRTTVHFGDKPEQ